MAQKNYDHKLRRRWAKRQTKNDINREAKLADFKRTEGRDWANAATSIIFGRR